MDSILLPNEIDMYIDAMKPQNIKNIGSHQWLEWHQRLQKLNQEALIEASAVREEHVKESLVSFGKVNILIHEAILINIWKHKVFPHLLKIEPNPESTFIAYSIFYHEAVCVALLELVLYHPNCCEALEDSAIDLLDYLSGTTSQLLSVTKEDGTNKENAEEELLRQRNNLAFDIGIRSLSIVRYLADSMDRLPISIYSRMYSTYDIPALFTQILMAAPWIKDGKQYIAGSWKTWDNEQLCQSEAQVWLTLRQLLLDPECSKYYAITESRRSQIMKLLPLMKPTILDQLSPLIELKQWLCRLSVTGQPSAPPKPLLLETVLEIKEKILQQAGGKWKKIAEKQVPLIFTNDQSALQDVAKKLNEAYNTDLLEKFEVKEQTACAQCGKGALQRCSNCKKSWYCSRSCQVNHWPQHKDDCIK
ncbi:zinc finger MYND domain-containing protein 10 [Anoplophora glabripennis]|uniref:zinc finger MYND domain-containing protein 10 n=1 Tax=Anoplophora glabripennis TaxID=217634 RepID=UPI000873B1E2|nr:zinc finger MYND domain-containing protein 10 [Anoplophora glabripennis]